jgi:CheY-like chemotaxis protein
VIINLALAARDALPHGGTILVETAGAGREDARGAALRLTYRSAVAPSPGATEFGAAAPTFDGERVGSSLGLAAVRGIVERSGGRVMIDATSDGGTISAFFPAAGGEQGAATAVAGPPRGAETILLAEDDESVRCVMGECLRDLGYRVLETRGGMEALAAAAAGGPIDLLLADVVMPAMSGVQLHSELAGARGALRVLYVSGCADEVLAHHGIHAPGTALLRKPFSPGMLAERVRRALDAPCPVA